MPTWPTTSSRAVVSSVFKSAFIPGGCFTIFRFKPCCSGLSAGFSGTDLCYHIWLPDWSWVEPHEPRSTVEFPRAHEDYGLIMQSLPCRIWNKYNYTLSWNYIKIYCKDSQDSFLYFMFSFSKCQLRVGIKLFLCHSHILFNTNPECPQFPNTQLRDD